MRLRGKEGFLDATSETGKDLLDHGICSTLRQYTNPSSGYWLDLGKGQDANRRDHHKLA